MKMANSVSKSIALFLEMSCVFTFVVNILKLRVGISYLTGGLPAFLYTCIIKKTVKATVFLQDESFRR